MKCAIIAIRHTIISSRAIEFDDPITASNVLTEKVKKLLKKDLEKKLSDGNI